MRNLVYIGLAILGIKYFANRASGARYLTGVRLQIKGVAPVGLNEIQVTFNIDNPNTKDAVVKSVVGDVYVNNTKVARVQTYNQVTVKGNAATIYPVSAKINLVRAARSVADLIKGVAGSTIRFVGTANIDNVAQPVNVTYKV